MRKDQTKFAEDITALALFILGIVLIVVLMCSCSTTQHSYYQDHLKTHHRNNFVNKGNGGCGWHN